LPQGWEIRLPNEPEWGKAARGGLEIPVQPVILPLGVGQTTPPQDRSSEVQSNPAPERHYPWGNEADSNCANYDKTGVGTTSAVGCFPGGISPYGVEELSGNVWEWTRCLWGKDFTEPDFVYPYNPADGRETLDVPNDVRRVLRGGSFFYFDDLVRCALRLRRQPELQELGLRLPGCCVPIHLWTLSPLNSDTLVLCTLAGGAGGAAPPPFCTAEGG
jgi:hypothetical protein